MGMKKKRNASKNMKVLKYEHKVSTMATDTNITKLLLLYGKTVGNRFYVYHKNKLWMSRSDI